MRREKSESSRQEDGGVEGLNLSIQLSVLAHLVAFSLLHSGKTPISLLKLEAACSLSEY